MPFRSTSDSEIIAALLATDHAELIEDARRRRDARGLERSVARRS